MSSPPLDTALLWDHASTQMKFIAVLAVLLASLVSSRAADLPAGFHLQPLQPLGGEAPMPDSWQFKGRATTTGYLYTFAAKFRPDETYDTGFRIQIVTKVNANSGGLTAREEVLKTRDHFKSAATKVLSECDEHADGLFQKLCLETIEPDSSAPDAPFHVLYSFYWSDSADLMVITIFGAPSSTWPEAHVIYDVMKDFVLTKP